MFIVTTLSHDELSALIKNGKVSLDNSKLLFGETYEEIDAHFKEDIGGDGYVLGLRGRLNTKTVELMSKLDHRVHQPDHVILEAEVNPDDLVRYNIADFSLAVQAFYHGMSMDTVREQLEQAHISDGEPGSVEVLCVPYIKKDSKIKVTTLNDKLNFNVEGITFVKIRR